MVALPEQCAGEKSPYVCISMKFLVVQVNLIQIITRLLCVRMFVSVSLGVSFFHTFILSIPTTFEGGDFLEGEVRITLIKIWNKLEFR